MLREVSVGSCPNKGRTDPIGPTMWPMGRHSRKGIWEMGWEWADCCLVAASLWSSYLPTLSLRFSKAFLPLGPLGPDGSRFTGFCPSFNLFFQIWAIEFG